MTAIRKTATLFPVLLALTLHGRDLEPYCWFYADFDTPMRMAGGEAPGSLAAAGYREDGKFGRSYYFHSKADNCLPKMATLFDGRDSITIAAHGSFQTPVVPVTLANAVPWAGVRDTALTGSLYIKGEKGRTATVRVDPVPLAPEQWKTLTNLCNNTANYSSPTNVAFHADSTRDYEIELTGEWQRAYGYALVDNREKLIGRSASMTVSAGDGAVEIRQLQLQQRGEYPDYAVRVPSAWVDGGTSVTIPNLTVTDPLYLKSFPCREGSLSAWVKCNRDDAAASHNFGFWGLHRSWENNWYFDGSSFGYAKSKSVSAPKGDMPWEWTHYAVTWKNGTVAIYTNGVKRVEKTGLEFEDMSVGSAMFRLGGYNSSAALPDCQLDDFAILTTALTGEEIAEIARSGEPLFSDSRLVLARPVSLPIFSRSQTNAAIRTRIYAFRSGAYSLGVTVDGKVREPVECELAAGGGKLVIPVEPHRYAVGEHDFSISLVDGGSNTVMSQTGRMTIMPAFDRERFRLNSWGGNVQISDGFLELTGVNCSNVDSESAARNATKRGRFVNLRYSNSGKVRTFDYDYAALRDAARDDFDYAEGLYSWKSTLVNTEVYGAASLKNYENDATFRSFAAEALGPANSLVSSESFGNGVNTGAAQVRWSQLGLAAPKGVTNLVDDAYATLYWYLRSGQPAYYATKAARDAVHAIDDSNVVWSEPVLQLGGLSDFCDMPSDWTYAYSMNSLLNGFLSGYGQYRHSGKPFQPTIAGYASVYGDNEALAPPAKQARLSYSADEFKILYMLALSSVRCDALGLFSLDSFEQGLVCARNYLADVSSTNALGNVSEPGDDAKVGAFTRERFQPAAELLRGLDNDRAPLALVITGEGDLAGAYNWSWTHYHTALKTRLAALGVPYDVVAERSITADNLKLYPYLLLTVAKVVTPAHDAAIRAAVANGSRVILAADATDAGVTYDNAITGEFKAGNYSKAGFDGWVDETFVPLVGELRGRLYAKSDRDVERDASGMQRSYTFTKRLDGVKFVTVINNARERHDDSLLCTFRTNLTYRPFGAGQTIATTLPDGPGYVYEFNAAAPRAFPPAVFPASMTYAPAESRVFCVYPRELTGVTAEVGGGLTQGGEAWVVVTVNDTAGPAPARQVVRLALTGPDGAERDESGLYTVSGPTRLPFRFHERELFGAESRPWRAVVTDLTSGLAATNSFTLRPERPVALRLECGRPGVKGESVVVAATATGFGVAEGESARVEVSAVDASDRVVASGTAELAEEGTCSVYLGGLTAGAEYRIVGRVLLDAYGSSEELGGGEGGTLLAETVANWINESATTFPESPGGVWTVPENRAAASGGTIGFDTADYRGESAVVFTPTNAVGDVKGVTLYARMCFGSECEDPETMPDGTFAGVRVVCDDDWGVDVGRFSFYSRGAWVTNRTWEVEPTSTNDFRVRLNFVTTNVEYAVATENGWEPLEELPFDASAVKLSDVLLLGRGEIETLKGDVAVITEAMKLPTVDPGSPGAAQEVANAVAAAEDAQLRARAADVGRYNEIVGWARGKGFGVGALLGAKRSYLSFAVDAGALVDRELGEDDLKLDSCVIENGRARFELSLKDVPVGPAAQSRYLREVFGATGTASLDAAFSAEEIEYVAEPSRTESGKIGFEVRPDSVRHPSPSKFFFRPRINGE